MLAGYHVYHDIQGPKFNIDHVVIDNYGVFAIETKTHAKPKKAYIADFDGRVIRYPDYTDGRAVKQARRNARYLQQRIQDLLGRHVPVTPVIVLPGWSVTLRKKPEGVFVLALGQVQNAIPRIRSQQLDARDVSRIVSRLETVCRSEAPYAVSSDDESKFAQKLTV